MAWKIMLQRERKKSNKLEIIKGKMISHQFKHSPTKLDNYKKAVKEQKHNSKLYNKVKNTTKSIG